MSKEHVESFLKIVHEDEGLGKEFQNCFAALQDHQDAAPKDQAKLVIDRVVKLGKSKGFDFDADEAHRAYRSAADQAKSELSDEELEQVAGGKSDKAKKTAQNVGSAIISWSTGGLACTICSASGALGELEKHGNTGDVFEKCMNPMTGGDGFG